jgi:hypothetical protein
VRRVSRVTKLQRIYLPTISAHTARCGAALQICIRKVAPCILLNYLLRYVHFSDRKSQLSPPAEFNAECAIKCCCSLVATVLTTSNAITFIYRHIFSCSSPYSTSYFFTYSFFLSHGRRTCREKLLGRPRYRWTIVLQLRLVEQGRKVWTGFIWLRIRTSGGLL